jgi:hypothetical protein
MLHTKGTRGWMRALVIVMVSLSLTLSMPAKPAMAVGVPVFDAASLAKLAESFVQQVTTKIINMAMQKLMQEANKALGPVVNMPLVGEILQPTLNGITQDLTDMVNRGSNDALAGIFRSPQQNFQDCMNNFACTSNIQLGSNFTASFSGDNPFKVTTPSALPAALIQNSFNFGDVAGLAVAPINLAGSATSVGSGVWEAITTGGNTVRFAYSGSTPPLAIAAGTAFTTSDAAVSPDFLKTMNLDVGNGALKFSNVALDGGNPYTMTASAPLIKAIERANSTNEVQIVNGIEVKPGLTVVGGKIVGDTATALNVGGADATVAFGSQGSPQIRANVGNALCPNLTEQDKAGGAVCRTADAAVSGLVGCAFGGNVGNCAQGVGKDVAQQLLGGVNQALGGALKGGGKSSGGLQVAAAEKAQYAKYFCPPNDNTAECIARVTAARNTDLAYSATEYIASAKAWQTKLPQMLADCNGVVARVAKPGTSNAILAARIAQEQCQNTIANANAAFQMKSDILDAQRYLLTAPTAIPPKG